MVTTGFTSPLGIRHPIMLPPMRELAAAFALGAQGATMGTRFSNSLAAAESSSPQCRIARPDQPLARLPTSKALTRE